jgi:hypothetical protein
MSPKAPIRSGVIGRANNRKRSRERPNMTSEEFVKSKDFKS